MKLLWVATKAPVPPRDGGRLVLGLTLAALRAAGHEITLLAPEAEGARPWASSVARALSGGLPVTIARHTLPRLRQDVAGALAGARFDAVVAEQLQALPQCEPAFGRGLPVVLRAQNVESDLWARQARAAWSLLGLEARRLERFECAALRRVALTLTLTSEDAARLRTLAGDAARVDFVAAPFPDELPAGPEPLPGSPALVVLAGAGWRPNRDGARWFVDAVWPLLRRSQPQARLHVFGDVPAAADVSVHPPPSDSAAAFPRGSIHVVPLQVASGVRMKVLEAWARGVPVIATSAAARGLEARPEQELWLADDALAFAAAVARVHGEDGVRERLVAGGRAALARRHDPAQVAARWTELLEPLARRRG